MDGCQAIASQIALPVETTHAMIGGPLSYTTVTSGWAGCVPGTSFLGAMDPSSSSVSSSGSQTFDMGSFSMSPSALDSYCGLSPHAVASYAQPINAPTSTMLLDALAPRVALSSCQMNPMQQHLASVQFTPQHSMTAVPAAPQHLPVSCSALPGVMLQPACSVPLGVLQQQKQQEAAGTAIFFAGVSPVAPPEDLLKVFAQFGRVMNINLYRPYRGCKTSKGCGLVEFAQHSEAAAALQTLDGKYVWRGANRPMSVEWYSSSSSTQASNAPGQGPIQPLSFTGPGHMALSHDPGHVVPPPPPATGQRLRLQAFGKQMPELPAVMPLMRWGL